MVLDAAAYDYFNVVSEKLNYNISMTNVTKMEETASALLSIKKCLKGKEKMEQ